MEFNNYEFPLKSLIPKTRPVILLVLLADVKGKSGSGLSRLISLKISSASGNLPDGGFSRKVGSSLAFKPGVKGSIWKRFFIISPPS